MTETRISVLARVFVDVPITAMTVDGVTADVTTDAVEVAIIDYGAPLADADFVAGTWRNVAGIPNASVLVGPGGAPSIGPIGGGVRDVHVRFTDSPEIPVLFAGTVEFY